MRSWVIAVALLVATAQASAEQKVGSITERAQYLKEFKSLLQSDDANIRLAAFDEGMRSHDDIIRSVTMETALSSEDEQMQTAGLRALFKRRNNFIATMELPADASDTQRAIYENLLVLELSRVNLDTENDEITAAEWQGHLIRGGLMLFGTSGTTQNCKLSAIASGGTTLVGAVECKLRKEGLGALPIIIELS